MHKKPQSASDREDELRARESVATERERAADSRDATLSAREEVASLRDEIAALRDEALRASAEAVQVRADRERLMDQMREANERLVIASDRAETLALEAEEARATATASSERFRTLVMTSAAIVWQADDQAHVQLDRDSWRTFTGADAVGDDGWLDAVHPQDRARVRDAWQHAAATGNAYSCEHRLRRPDQSYGHVIGRAVPIKRAGVVREWIGTITDVTDKVRLDEARDRFIAILSHDLRTPLSSILVGTDVLRGLGIGEPYARTVDQMARAAYRIEAMTRDVMDFARGRFGDGIPATLQPCDLGTLAAEEVAELRLAFPNRTINCETRGSLRGEWDPDRLEQVVSNLVGNAVAHGDDPITVTATDEGDEVVLAIHNRGEPIASETLPILFEPFAQGSRTTSAGSKGSEGLGLGLYIVHEIVRAHGGTISVASTREAGTTFTTRWPRDPVARARIGKATGRLR